MWQVRRGLNILHGATPETLKDLFATTSEVEKMDGMVQTLQSMLAVIEARKAVVEEREAARLAQAAVPAVQGSLSSFLRKPAHPVQVTSISDDATAEVEASAPNKGGRPRGKRLGTNKDLRDGATERRVSSRSSGSTSASPYVEPDLRRSNRIDHMDAEPNYPAPNMNDAAAKAARKKIKRAEKKEATLQQNRERQATAMKDEQLLYETLAKEVDNTLDDAALSRSDKALRGAIMGVLRFLASSDHHTTRGKAYHLAALYSNFSERTVRRHFERYWKTGELPASQQGRPAPLDTSASSRRSAILNSKVP